MAMLNNQMVYCHRRKAVSQQICRCVAPDRHSLDPPIFDKRLLWQFPLGAKAVQTWEALDRAKHEPTEDQGATVKAKLLNQLIHIKKLSNTAICNLYHGRIDSWDQSIRFSIFYPLTIRSFSNVSTSTAWQFFHVFPCFSEKICWRGSRFFVATVSHLAQHPTCGLRHSTDWIPWGWTAKSEDVLFCEFSLLQTE